MLQSFELNNKKPCILNNTVLIYKKIEIKYFKNITQTVKDEIITDVSKLETATFFIAIESEFRIRLRG